MFNTAGISLSSPLSPLPLKCDAHVVSLQRNVSQCVQIWIFYISNRVSFTQLKHLWIFTMVAYFLRWTLLKFLSSISDEQSQQIVRQWDRITCTVINTSNEAKFSLLWEFWIYNLSWRILERVFVGSIVNIRNECLFFWVHGEWIVARNKQIAREPLRGSRDLFVPRYDSFPMNPEKRHSFLNTNNNQSEYAFLFPFRIYTS